MDVLWYALRVRSRFEKLVETQLERKGYEVFLPQRVLHRRWSDRVKSLSLPLFPNYVFCRFDFHTRLPILLTPGVDCVVGAGQIPVAVEETELAALRHVLESRVILQEWPYLKEGMRVRVEAGPLEGLVGIVVRGNRTDRVIVSLSLLMRSVAVDIDRTHVHPLGPDDAVATPNMPAIETPSLAPCRTAQVRSLAMGTAIPLRHPPQKDNLPAKHLPRVGTPKNWGDSQLHR